jgi:hypothetical protein
MKKQLQNNGSDFLDSNSLLEFEGRIFKQFALLWFLPFFKNWRLGKAIDKWFKES